MAAHSQLKASQTRQYAQRAVILVIALIFLYVILPQIKAFKSSFSNIAHADKGSVFIALLLTIATFFVASNMYQLLKKHKIRYGNTLLVQVSSGFANRLLPAGIGGMGLFVQYLRKQKHTTTQALTVVGLNNIIGVIGHFFLFGIVLIFSNVSLSSVHIPKIAKLQYVFVLLVIVVIIYLVFFRKLRDGIVSSLKQILKDASEYKDRPYILFLAFVNSLVITFLYVGILYTCMRALRVDLSVAKVMVVFTVGSIIGNATPTPGGLVATEAGLFAGFVAYGVNTSDALSIALLYRFLTYWLPIIPGIVAFWFAQKKLKLIS